MFQYSSGLWNSSTLKSDDLVDFFFLWCEGETSGLLLKICYFEVIFNLQEGTKKYTVRSPCTPLPKLTSYITTVQYQSQEIGSGRIHTYLTHISPVIYVPMCMCVVLCNFTMLLWRTTISINITSPQTPSRHPFIATPTPPVAPDNHQSVLSKWCYFINTIQMELCRVFPPEIAFFFLHSSIISLRLTPLYHWVLFHGIDVSQFVHPLKDIWVFSSLGLLQIKPLLTFLYAF